MANWTGPVGWLTEKLTRPKKKKETSGPGLRETTKKARGWVNTKDIISKRKREQEELLKKE